jgi:hypothetical protein
MHWARRHVNPMVALHAMAGSNRWQEAWPQMARYGRCQTQQKRQQRQLARRPAKAPMPLVLRPSAPPLALAPALTESPRPSPPSKPTVHQASKGPCRPPPDHPWRRFPVSWRGGSAAQKGRLRKTLTHTPHSEGTAALDVVAECRSPHNRAHVPW